MNDALIERPVRAATRWKFHQSIALVAVVAIAAAVFLVAKLLFSWGSEKRDEFFANPQWVQQLQNLELARTQRHETLTRSEVVSVTLPLKVPFIEKELKSKADYNIQFDAINSYFVAANPSDWSILLKGDELFVVAPRILAGPHSIDTASIKATVDGGYFVLGEAAKLEELKKDLTRYARTMAEHPDVIHGIRANCRESLESFITDWLKLFPKIHVRSVTVRFADEAGEVAVKQPKG